MSEEMAEYMGIQIQIIKTIKYPDGFTFYYEEDYLGYTETKYHNSWDCIHEVWEKVKNQKILLTKENIIEFKWHRTGIEACIINNILPQAFTALFNCIQFINRLKQQNE